MPDIAYPSFVERGAGMDGIQQRRRRWRAPRWAGLARLDRRRTGESL